MTAPKFALFLLACVTLLVEVLLTRIFDVLLWPNLSFMIISCALFGLALGGLFEMLAPARLVAALSLPRATAAFAISVWALPLLVNAIPFSLYALSAQPVRQLAWFLLLYLALLAPFALAGICLCRLFSTAVRDIQRLYFWDLSGAALGTAVLIPLLPRLGPAHLLLTAAMLALVASALFGRGRRWALTVGGVGVLLVAAASALGPRYDTLALHDDKRGTARAIRLGRLEFSAWDPVSEIADLSRFFAFPADREPSYRLVENPLDPAASFLPQAFYSGALPPELVAASPYNITPLTDDRPWFSFLRRSPSWLSVDRARGVNASVAAHLNSQLRRGWLPMDWLHLIVAGIASVFYGVLFVAVPMLVSRVGRQPWRGKAPALVYFALLGFAFIAVELLFIQMYMKLIGYPLYAVATVITVMLIGAALGSMSSGAVAGEGGRRWAVAFAGIAACGMAVLAFTPAVAGRAMAAPMPARITAAALTILPTAFFMGMPFPLGVLELRDKPAGAVAWAWSMNGLCTTIGSVATMLLAVSIGFRGTLLVALAAYVLAGVCFAALRRSNRAEGRVPAVDLSPLPQSSPSPLY